jgi:hypothetical protein
MVSLFYEQKSHPQQSFKINGFKINGPARRREAAGSRSGLGKTDQIEERDHDRIRPSNNTRGVEVLNRTHPHSGSISSGIAITSSMIAASSGTAPGRRRVPTRATDGCLPRRRRRASRARRGMGGGEEHPPPSHIASAI